MCAYNVTALHGECLLCERLAIYCITCVKFILNYIFMCFFFFFFFFFFFVVFCSFEFCRCFCCCCYCFFFCFFFFCFCFFGVFCFFFRSFFKYMNGNALFFLGKPRLMHMRILNTLSDTFYSGPHFSLNVGSGFVIFITLILKLFRAYLCNNRSRCWWGLHWWRPISNAIC